MQAIFNDSVIGRCIHVATPRQANFRMDEVTSDLWDKVREEAGLKNGELFSRMLEVYSTSACVDSLSHAEEMREVQETMGAAVAQMAGVLGKVEARSRPASERSRAERLRGRLAAASERADELAAKLRDDRESEGRMREERDEAIAQRDEVCLVKPRFRFGGGAAFPYLLA